MKRILFVDDEPDLLSGLRARLHKRRHEWEMVFLPNGMAAIDELQKQHADLIVTDVRMPGMDGGQLLSAMKARWPETIRIVMSGYAEPSKMLQLVALAHRYVSKPCDAEQLENVIERCFQLDSLLRDEKVKALVGRIGALPAMPKTYARLQAALGQPDVTSHQVADIISDDPMVAAKVLQVANSAFFRLAKKISRIRDAVAYLGFASIRNLVMSAEVFSQWEKLKTPPGLQPERLQAHAQHVAGACVALAANTPLADDALLVGLIHDIGYWVLIQECPTELQHALTHAAANNLSSEQAEREVLGTTHAEIGAYLLGLWGFPYNVVEAVAFHHAPQAVKQQSFDLLAVLSVAHSLCADLADGVQLSSEVTPIADQSYFEQLTPPYDWQEAQRRVEHICELE